MDWKEIKENVYRRLIAQNYQDTLFGDLQKFTRQGSGYMACCPFHDDKNPSFSISKDEPVYHCFSCGASGDWIKYMMERRGIPFPEAIEELSRAAGIELTDHDRGEREKNLNKKSLLEATQAYFTGELFKAGGKEVLEYLTATRKYTEDEIKKMGLGYYPDPGGLEKHLKEKGHDPATINAAGLKTGGFGTTHRLTIPYRSPAGDLKSFICRMLSPDVENKYKNSAGVTMDTFINQTRSGKGQKFIIVEGPLDALISTARGVEGVVATGTNSINDAQMETLKRSGVRDVILCFDSNDQRGAEGTERALTRLNSQGIRAYVITLPGGHKDPDELLRTGEEGLAKFKELIANPTSGARWMVERLLKHDPKSDLAANVALDKALKYAATLRHPLDRKQCRESIRTAMDISESDLEAVEKEYRLKWEEDQEVTRYQSLISRGGDMIQKVKSGQVSIGDLRQFVNGEMLDIRSRGVAGYVEPYTLDRYLEDLKTSREGLKTGWSDLDGIIKIPQEAVTIIAGRPSHGKTTFLLNLYLNLIENDPAKTFLYFSYEEGQRRLTSKLITIMGETELSQWNNVDQVEARIKFEKLDQTPEIKEARDKFKKYTEDGRMLLISEPFYVDELCNTVAHLADRFDVGAVLIDYIQKVKTRGKYPTRQASIQKVSEALVESAIKLKIPFILGAQFNRQVETMTAMNEVHLREAGDIEQDANLIIGLWNPEKAPEVEMGEVTETYFDEEGNRSTRNLIPGPDDIIIKIMKNRDGIAPIWTTLKFNRPILKLEDRLKIKGQ